MTKDLQDMVDNLVTEILEYDSGSWSSKANNLTKEQAECIASQLINDWVVNDLVSADIEERYNDLKLGDKND